MGRKILFDGQIKFIDSINIKLDSPALNHGLGLFETLLYENGKLFFLNEHIKRLMDSCRALNISKPEPEHLKEDLITGLITSEGHEKRSYRVKILYAPLFSLEKWNLAVSVSEYKRNPEAIQVKVSENIRENSFYKFKTISYMQNFLLAGNDPETETLFLNSSGHIIEGTRSNILCIKGKDLYYVDRGENYLQGIMQDKIIKNYKVLNFRSVIPVKGGFSADLITDYGCAFISNSLIIAKNIRELKLGENIVRLYQPDLTENIRNTILNNSKHIK